MPIECGPSLKADAALICMRPFVHGIVVLDHRHAELMLQIVHHHVGRWKVGPSADAVVVAADGLVFA